MNKIDNESAVVEFNRFLDAQKVSKSKRAKLEEEQETIISFIEEGIVVVKDNGDIVYNIVNPSEDVDEPIESVTFAVKRYKTRDIEKAMVGRTDMHNSRLMLGMLTGVNSGVFSNMDADDFKNCTDIAGFFLPR